MSLLLDTHALEWAFNDSHRLADEVRVRLGGLTAREIFLSDVSLAELGRHLQRGHITTSLHGREWLRRVSEHVTVLPVTADIAWHAAVFDWQSGGQVHRDSADRLIVATALVHRLPLATVDRKIHEFAPTVGLAVIW